MGVIGIGVAAIYFFAILPWRFAENEKITTDRLRFIAYALQAYHDQYRCYPPAFIPDESGQLRKSWRVGILPFLEYEMVAEMYNDNEMWNSPNNEPLSRMRLPFFQSPLCDGEEGETPFMVVVGPQTAFPGATSTRRYDCTDGASNTILVVANLEDPVPWSEPGDLSLEDFTKRFSAKDGQQPPLYVALMDGSVVRVMKIQPSDLASLANINDGKQFERDQKRFEFEYPAD